MRHGGWRRVLRKPPRSVRRRDQFAHFRTYPDSAFTDRASPNADTLYSVAWLDLSRGPVVLSVPDMGNQYHLCRCCDAWTNVFAAPGTRTTGNIAGEILRSRDRDGLVGYRRRSLASLRRRTWRG